METLSIPGKEDFKRWVNEAVKELSEKAIHVSKEEKIHSKEPLISRDEVKKEFTQTLGRF